MPAAECLAVWVSSINRIVFYILERKAIWYNKWLFLCFKFVFLLSKVVCSINKILSFVGYYDEKCYIMGLRNMLKRLIKYVLMIGVLVAGEASSAQAATFADYVYQNVRRGNISNIKAYMAKGYNINATNSRGMTALCQAVDDENYVAYSRLRQLGSSVKSDCMQRVDDKTAAQFEKKYLQSTSVGVSNSATVSSDAATYTAVGLLAAGAATAAIVASNNGSSHHKKGCPGGQILVDGECKCPTGQKMVGNECEPIICPEGTHLVGDDCEELICPEGQVIVGNYCTSVTCPVGQVMQDGVCVDIVCPEGQVLRGNICIVDCDEGFHWNGSSCVINDCPPGQHLLGDHCIDNDTCPVGQKWNPDAGACLDVICPEGMHLFGDGCIDDERECPIGQHKVGDECVPIECPANTHLVGNLCVVGDLNIENNNNNNIYGVASENNYVFNLYSSPIYPNEQATIVIDNTGDGDVYGLYGYKGETFNSYVIGYDAYYGEDKVVDVDNKEPVGTASINIVDRGKGTVYGMYSNILDVTENKQAVNAYGVDVGTAYGNININHTGGGATYGLLGTVRAFNTRAGGLFGNAIGNIAIKGDGDIYGIYGYVAAVNGLIVEGTIGNYSRGVININSVGDGNVYGMAINKDDIPGAGAGGEDLASWWAFNSYGGAGTVSGTIDIHNTGNGNVYGMYGGQQLYNAMTRGGYSEGNINITNLGKGKAYGMYMPEADEDGIIANVSGNKVQSNINLVNVGDGIMTGMRGGRSTNIINSGEININNIGNGTAVGIYGELGSLIKNSGIINIYRSAYHDDVDGKDYVPVSSTGGTAYGIYGESGSSVQNSGTITISGAGNGAGIYLEKNAYLVNTGTVQFNGEEGSIVENGAPKNIYGENKSLANVDLNTMGQGEIILGTGGKFFAESLSGDMSVSETSVQGSFDNEYNLDNALQAKDTSGLNLVSKSVMFNAKKVENQNNGYDVVMERKPFVSLLNNKSTAEFLESNYTQENNLELYDDLKAIQNSKEFKSVVANRTGNDVLPSFRVEDATVYRHLSKQFNDNLFDRPSETYMGGYKYIDISRDKDGDLVGNDGAAHSAYGLLKGKSDRGLTYGLGATISQIKTDYDNDSSRKSNTFGLWAPVGYDFNNGTKWFSKLYVGYEDGSYDRKTSLGKYSADINSYQYGLSNEIRHDMLLGSTGIRVTPVAELNFLGNYLDSFDEGYKVEAIHADSTNMLSLEGGLGAYLSKEFNINQDNKLGVKIGGVYYVEFLDPDDGIDVSQVGMVQKHKVSHKSDDSRSVLSARIDYSYKNLLFYGELEKEVGDNDAVVIDAGMQYNFK